MTEEIVIEEESENVQILPSFLQQKRAVPKSFPSDSKIRAQATSFPGRPPKKPEQQFVVEDDLLNQEVIQALKIDLPPKNPIKSNGQSGDDEEYNDESGHDKRQPIQNDENFRHFSIPFESHSILEAEIREKISTILLKYDENEIPFPVRLKKNVCILIS